MDGYILGLLDLCSYLISGWNELGLLAVIPVLLLDGSKSDHPMDI